MRILQVTLSYYPESQFGGQPEKIRALTKGLRARGHELQVLALHSGRPFTHARRVEEIPVQYLAWTGKGTHRIPHSLRPIRRLVQWADVIHCYGLYNLLCPIAAFWAHRVGRPYIVEPLGMYAPKTRNLRAKRFYHRAFTAPMMKRAALIIATSPVEREELAPLRLGERLVLRRDGVDTEDFANLRRATERLTEGENFRARHGIDSDEKVLLYIGRISAIKNLESLVLAFEKAALPRTRLVLAGPMLEEDYAQQLRSVIEKADLTKRVILAGPVYEAEKKAALAAADGFVLPSHFESFGIAAAEAVASGLPVLLTDKCGIAPLIHQRAGLAVSDSVTELVRGLGELFDNSSRQATLTQQRSQVIEELSWNQPVEQMEQIYQDLKIL